MKLCTVRGSDCDEGLWHFLQETLAIVNASKPKPLQQQQQQSSNKMAYEALPSSRGD